VLPNVTGPTGVAEPSSPVWVIESSHSGAGDVAPVDRYSCFSAHESTAACAPPSSVLVVIVVSWYLSQNVGEATPQVAPDEHARSWLEPVGTSVRVAGEVKFTSAAGVPYPLADRSPYWTCFSTPPWV